MGSERKLIIFPVWSLSTYAGTTSMDSLVSLGTSYPVSNENPSNAAAVHTADRLSESAKFGFDTSSSSSALSLPNAFVVQYQLRVHKCRYGGFVTLTDA